MIVNSPFRYHKFEHQPPTEYYLPDETGVLGLDLSFQSIEGPKSFYLYGTRGSGKTTLLHALSASERISNQSLKKALGGNPYRGNLLGCYFRLPEYEFKDCAKKFDSIEKSYNARIVSLFLDLIWTPIMLDNLLDAKHRGVLKNSANDESLEVEAFLSSQNWAFFNTNGIHSFAGLSQAISNKREELALCLISEEDNAKQIIEIFGKNKICEFGNTLGKFTTDYLNKYTSSRYENWNVKVLIDEAEYFSELQQSIFNKIVSISKWPVTFTVAYAKRKESLNTSETYDKILLQTADREEIDLFEMDKENFKIYVENVVRERLKKILNHDQVNYNTRAILGSININKYLHFLLTISEKKEAKEILRESEKWSEVFRPKRIKNKDKVYPPIYQYYLISKGLVNLDELKSDKVGKRRQESAEIRKRMVAAYVSLCSELELTPIYASSEMVIGLSDNSIRDYLMQMQSILDQTKLSIEDFLKVRELDYRTQTLAVRERAEQKVLKMMDTEVSDPDIAAIIIDILGKLTKLVQTKARNYENLKSSERGKFFIEFDSNSSRDMKYIRLIESCENAGFLMITNREIRRIAVRIHNSIAAKYNVSYRNAFYYVTGLTISQLHQIITTKPEKRENLINNIGLMIATKDDPQQEVMKFED